MDGTSSFNAAALPTRNTQPSTTAAPGITPLDSVSKWHRILLWASVLAGALTHGWHLFEYPLYITDEGIYMERAWAVLREGALSPYTYYL